MSEFEMSSALGSALIGYRQLSERDKKAIRARLRKAGLSSSKLDLTARIDVESNLQNWPKSIFFLTWNSCHLNPQIRKIINDYLDEKVRRTTVKPEIPFVKILQPGVPFIAKFVTLEEFYEMRIQAIAETLERFDQATIFDPTSPTG